MQTQTRQVHSQVIPLANLNIILPNTSVAEIIHYRQPHAIDNAPAWMLGLLEWRGLQIPLISMEGASGKQTAAINDKSRIAVINAITGHDKFHFFGLLTQGIPHLVKIGREDLNALDSTDKGKFILANVQVDETKGAIPDLEALESLIISTGLIFKH